MSEERVKHYTPIARTNFPNSVSSVAYYRGLRFLLWFSEDGGGRGRRYLRDNKPLNEFLDMLMNPDSVMGFGTTCIEMQDDYLVVHQDGPQDVLLLKLEESDEDEPPT